MKTLLQPDSFIMSAIGDGSLPPVGTVCRPSLFALPVRIDGSELVFNTFTRQLIDPCEKLPLFSDGSEIVFDGLDESVIELIKVRFIVAADADEVNTLSGAVKVLQLLGRKDNKKHRAFVILPTTVCNARCFYCYESGIEYRTMDDSTIDAVLKYILATKTDGKIAISWFGGEPLAAEHVIDRIVDGLAACGVELKSSMITNASLMTRELAKKAVEKWHLTTVQITLDGRREEYLKRKAYVDSSRDHYSAALDAAAALSDLGCSVTFRLNADENNIDDLLLLADELKLAFGDRKNVSVYAHDIFADCGETYSSEEIEALYPRLSLLDEKLIDLGLFRSRKPNRLRTHRCMVDMPNGASVIAPDGTLYCCEHFSEKSRIGTVWDYETEADTRRSFIRSTARLETHPECRRCVYLPECTLTAHCPVISRDCRRSVNSILFKNLLLFSKNVL